MEALQRALSDQGLTVSTLPEKGRCLFTTRDFRPGEVIVRENPYVWVPDKSGSEPRCDGCLSARNLKRCSACEVVWYCGTKCQKEVQKLHRRECFVLSELAEDTKKSLRPFLRLMLRLCIRRKLETEKVIPATTMENYELVRSLASLRHDINEDNLEYYGHMANLVNLLIQFPDISRKEIIENFSKLACNAHTMIDHGWVPTGCGLFLVVSTINHSCLPNSVLVFEGKSAVLHATQHIAKDSEVFISYIVTTGSTMTRQKTLREQYHFTCRCLRCIKSGQFDDVRESAIREGFQCKNSECDGFLLRDSGADGIGYICQRCGLVRSNEEITEMESEIKSLSDKAISSTSSQNSQEEISTYKAMEKLQMKLCHRFSISLMRTREKLHKMFMILQDWSEALAYCRLAIGTYERLYLELHPALGLQYYTCGKLELKLGDTENAVKSLTKAVDVLRVVCGADSSFMKELLMNLDEARSQASNIQ